ncbi:hypothetical protein C8J37_1232 [Rhizobium sp. PP-WC-1G-195]|nr:hypothetical protein C8J37_1232 [Rhizobium sp. PP-WC-1G-195]
MLTMEYGPSIYSFSQIVRITPVPNFFPSRSNLNGFSQQWRVKDDDALDIRLKARDYLTGSTLEFRKSVTENSSIVHPATADHKWLWAM